MFTTIVCLDQIGQGHFSLEDKASTYLPEYRNVSTATAKPVMWAESSMAVTEQQVGHYNPATHDAHCWVSS